MPIGIYKRTKKIKENLGKINLGRKQSSEAIKNRMASRKGYRHSEDVKEKIKKSLIGHEVILETRRKLSQYRGEKSSNWNGGTSSLYKRMRHTLEYRLWRESVFKRDNYTCIWCGARNGDGKAIILNADHIKPFAYYPELRFAIDNGRTLCVDCHKTTNTYLNKGKNWKEKNP